MTKTQEQLRQEAIAKQNGNIVQTPNSGATKTEQNTGQPKSQSKGQPIDITGDEFAANALGITSYLGLKREIADNRKKDAALHTEQATKNQQQVTTAQSLFDEYCAASPDKREEVINKIEAAAKNGDISNSQYLYMKNGGNYPTTEAEIAEVKDTFSSAKANAEEGVRQAQKETKEAEKLQQEVAEEAKTVEAYYGINQSPQSTQHPESPQPSQEEVVEYWDPVTKDSNAEVKSKVASVYPTEMIDGGTIGQPVTASQFLAYLQNPEQYTDPKGSAFARSDVGTKYLSQLNKPSEQAKAASTMADMLNDPQQSYDLQPGQEPIKGTYVMTTSKDGKESRKGLNPKTADGQALCEDMKSKGLLTGGPAEDASAASNSNESGGASNSTAKDKEVKPPDYTPSKVDPKQYEKNSKENPLSIGHCNNVPYFRVNGYNKIRFPDVWSNGPYHIPIMGLPPMRVQKNFTDPLISTNAFDLVTVDPFEPVPAMYAYDEDAQLKNSFLKLTIHPIDVEFLTGANGDEDYHKRAEANKADAIKKSKNKNAVNQYSYVNRSVVVWDVEYNFAVQVSENNITIGHSNRYSASGLESKASTAFEKLSNTFRSVEGVSQTGGGYSDLSKSGGSILNKLGGKAQETAKQVISDLSDSIGDVMQGAEADLAHSFVSDLDTLLKEGVNSFAGARVDMPDIWADSATDIRYTVKIDLRSMCPNPLDIQYHKDILIPLYILYTLALPTDTGKVTYKTPPYIYCNLDKFFKIKLGAITNMEVDLHLNEFNFRRAPRHVTVTLTIRDLYSVMKQDVWDINNKK